MTALRAFNVQRGLLPGRLQNYAAHHNYGRRSFSSSSADNSAKFHFLKMAAATSSDKNSSSTDPYFKQTYLQLDAESATTGPIETEVTGQIPAWLEGSLFRNGPGIFTVGETHLKHLFDGFAVLHRFDLHKGKVTYTSRVLDTESWQRSVKANRLVTTQFGTYAHPDPCKTLFSRVMTYFKPRWEGRTDNTSVNIVEHGDRLYTLTETPVMLAVDPKTLQIAHKDSLDRVIAVHMATAHPHFDQEGNMYNLGTAFNPPNNYNIVKVSPPKPTDKDPLASATLLASLQSRWTFSMGYNHSFGMSRDHFVILEQPVTMQSFKFLTCNWRRASVLDNFDKHPGLELVFRLVRRSDGQEVPIKYRAETAFTFHFVNCFEEDEALVVDFVGFSNLDILHSLYLERLDESGVAADHPTFRRYVLPLSVAKAEVGQNLVKLPNTRATAVLRRDGTVFLTPDIIVEDGCHMELPRINYAMSNTKKYRYAYGTSLFSEKQQLKKLDLEKREELTWFEKGYMPGEPVFVQRPGATEEDDGVILSPVISQVADRPCYLLVLDAHTFQELGRAVTPTNTKMALSFHGSYLPQK